MLSEYTLQKALQNRRRDYIYERKRMAEDRLRCEYVHGVINGIEEALRITMKVSKEHMKNIRSNPKIRKAMMTRMRTLYEY